ALAKQPLQEGAQQFISIPATIQYMIWSDVYKCQGMVTIHEPTGRVNNKTGQPVLKKARRPRGCGEEIVLWDAAVCRETAKVRESFSCPACGLKWKKTQVAGVRTIPVSTNYHYQGLRLKKRSRVSEIIESRIRASRPTTSREKDHIRQVESCSLPAD